MSGRRLTCHVLDVSGGIPAAGVAVSLSRVEADSPVLITSAVTNADGRTDAPLLEGEDLITGRYELAFAIGDYFRGEDDLVSTPYLDVVPIHFGVADETVHLHVALLVTPWSYTTYRGS